MTDCQTGGGPAASASWYGASLAWAFVMDGSVTCPIGLSQAQPCN